MFNTFIKTPIIFFSGLDRCGKSITRKKFAEETNQKFITFERSFIDNVVYNEIFRNDKLSNREFGYLVTRMSLSGPIIIVYLILDFKEINRRAFQTERVTYKISELKSCKKLFDKYMKKTSKLGISLIKIDCNHKSVIEIVKEIEKNVLLLTNL